MEATLPATALFNLPAGYCFASVARSTLYLLESTPRNASGISPTARHCPAKRNGHRPTAQL